MEQHSERHFEDLVFVIFKRAAAAAVLVLVQACGGAAGNTVVGCRVGAEVMAAPDWTVDYASETACTATSTRMCTVCQGAEQPIPGGPAECLGKVVSEPCEGPLAGTPVFSTAE